MRIVRKLRRLVALVRLLLQSADGATRTIVRRCYADLGACLRDTSEIEVRMRGDGGPVTCRLRRSDVFTLSEIFAEGVYLRALPLPTRPFVVDAGANVGIASVWFKARCPGARIAAFEPDADNARLARTNLAPFADCEVHEVALDRECGTATLFRGDHDAVHSLVDDSAGAGAAVVRTTTLAAFLDGRDERRIDVLKLDVEGAELRVLEGMGEWIARTDVVIGELHEEFVSEAELRRALAAGGLDLDLDLFDLEDAERVRGFVARRRVPSA